MNQIKVKRTSKGHGRPDSQAHSAFLKASENKISDKVYGSDKMLKFFEVIIIFFNVSCMIMCSQLKGRQHAADKQMLVPGYLVAVSNCMGLAKVIMSVKILRSLFN